MQTKFKDNNGQEFAPKFFAVYYPKKGGSFRKVQSKIDPCDFDEYEDIKRIELYENGTNNLSAELKNWLDNPDCRLKITIP